MSLHKLKQGYRFIPKINVIFFSGTYVSKLEDYQGRQRRPSDPMGRDWVSVERNPDRDGL